MIRIVVCCMVLIAGIQHAAVAEQEWASLFDGKTLKGWSRVGLGKAEYVVKEGTIYGKTVEGSPNTFLGSDQEYGDFELEFEVKVHDKLNSGVQIRSREKTAADVDQETKGKKRKRNQATGRFFGPQVEIEASPGQAGFVYGEATGRGWLSEEPQDKTYSHDLMKNGEWNHFRIVAKGPRIQTWINGQKVEDLTDEPIYKTHPKGKIGLQVHGIGADAGPYDVAWRNIRIREL